MEILRLKPRASFGQGAMKRGLDIIGALFLLMLFTPFIIVSAIAIRISGSREIIFRQRRIGKYGEQFDILKLSTMSSNAHKEGPLVSTAKDSRITPPGKFLRAFCLNELPQLINVLKGDMSLVGPRPEVEKYLHTWPEDVKERVLSVRPGLTGYATVRIWDEAWLLEGRLDVEKAYIEEILPYKLGLEMWYVGHQTVWLDVKILFFTFLKALMGGRLAKRNARKNSLWKEEEAW